MRLYHVERKYTVSERYRVWAEFEEDAINRVKAGSMTPTETVKSNFRINGSWPIDTETSKLAIHHIDGNPYNNDPANLRIVDIRARD